MRRRVTDAGRAFSFSIWTDVTKDPWALVRGLSIDDIGAEYYQALLKDRRLDRQEVMARFTRFQAKVEELKAANPRQERFGFLRMVDRPQEAGKVAL